MSVQDQMGPELAKSFGVPGGKGVVITEVVGGGPAARAGLRPGDVIISFDGEPMAESYRLRWLTANAAAGRTVRMGIWRERALRTVAVTLESKPGEEVMDQPVPLAPARKDPELGLSVDEQQGRPGVRISAIDPRGAAYRAGLREGDLVLDVDGRAVSDRASLRKALGASGDVVRMYVRRNGRALFFGIRRDAGTAQVQSR
jgi:S1-C subfamily serine protease